MQQPLKSAQDAKKPYSFLTILRLYVFFVFSQGITQHFSRPLINNNILIPSSVQVKKRGAECLELDPWYRLGGGVGGRMVGVRAEDLAVIKSSLR
jgi:hypothetical protein